MISIRKGLFVLSCFAAINANVLFAGQQQDLIYANSPTCFWVFFADKNGTTFDPFSYFDSKAIDRRLRHGVCLYDSTDFPVNDTYLAELHRYVDSVSVVSRWLNACFVYASMDQINNIIDLPFVTTVAVPQLSLLPACHEENPDSRFPARAADYPQLQRQLSHMQGQYFGKHGFSGKGIRIAVFDAGFPGVDRHPAFRHLRENGQIIDTWDFHRNRADVYRYNVHGTMVLSMIAGMSGDQPMGLATEADFLLARTEIRREPLAEEKYWIAAIEWADRMGADLVNSSLGYFHHRYFPEQMDGRTSLVARAANIAAGKGLLIVNAAGNEGETSHWRIIITPADADSVLTIGAVEYPSMLRTSYSSLGPTANKTMKPNLMAMGNVLVANRRGYTEAKGTSFASPLVAGFAACLWQMFPEWTNMQIFRALETTGSLYPYFDYAHGFGVPQAGYFFEREPAFVTPTFDLIVEEGIIHAIARQDPMSEDESSDQNRFVFYHIRNEDGFILNYFVVKPQGSKFLSLNTNDFLSGQHLFVHYNGYTASHTF